MGTPRHLVVETDTQQTDAVLQRERGARKFYPEIRHLPGQGNRKQLSLVGIKPNPVIEAPLLDRV
jgi:hypothetical protein